MEGSVVTKRALEAATVPEAFRITAAERESDVAVRMQGGEQEWTWGELRDRVDALAAGLHALGLRRGDSVALLLSNRPEFHQADIAAMTVGATPFSIYNTYSPEQIQYVCSDAEAKVAITQADLVAGLLKAREDLPALEHVIVVDGEAPEGTISLDEAVAKGEGVDFDPEASIAEIDREDVLTLIYTSGTTGPPKGVQLVHRNLMSLVHGVQEIIPLGDGARVISWLPAAHIAERGAHHYLPIVYGGTVTCCADPRQVLEVVKEVHPNWFFAVPRIWEKLKAGLEAMLAGLPDEQREKAQGALKASIKRVQLQQAGEEVPDELEQIFQKADAELFSNLRLALGFDQIEAVNVGAAPTPVEVLEFFHAIGIPVAELWGMSETCGAATANPPEKIKIGTVGPVLPGVEVKLAEDGELLCRGDLIMKGYRNLPEKTAEALDDEGWMHTGDIATIDDEGYVKIVDRKKEIIINAAGKNMSPANIEAAVKSSSPLIGQAACIGDARPYNVALIVLDADFAPGWAEQQGIEDTSMEALAKDDKVRAAVQEGIDAANEKLARVEQIKKFHICPADWLPGGDELTPTMKLKRKPIDQKYSDDIEALYQG